MKKLLPLLLVFLVTSLAMAQCDYTLELTDNFGSDWDSGDNLASNTGVDVTVAGVTTTYIIVDPSPTPNMPVVENYTITVNNGDALSIDYRATFFPGDGGFRLLDSEGIEVYSSPINQPSMMDIFTGTATCPTCFAVTALTTNAITASSAEIGWTATGAETAWEVEYGPVGFTPGSGTTDNATSNPWTINGLMSDTAYDVYVRADCGMGDISSNQGPISFTTTESCPAPGAFTPVTNTATTVQVIWDANGNQSLDYEIEYGVSPYTQGSGGQTTQGGTAPFAEITGLTPNTSYDFYVRIDCGMGDFSGWSGPYTSSTLQSCPDVSSINFSNIDQTSVDIDWVAGGSETEWEIEYGPAPLTPGSGTTVTALSNPFTLTGLLSGTSYDICITAVCAANDRSTPVCATLLTPADYCNGDQLVDSGGAGGSYSPNEDITYTVCPDNAGDVVYVDFIEFMLEDSGSGCFDGLTVYDGPDTSSPTINPPNGGTEWCWDTNSGTGNLVGEILIGKLPSGCITFVFQSDGSVQRDGFVANVTCAAPPTCPAPTDLTFDGSTNTSVDLSWIAGGSETEWNIEYGAPGFTPGSGTVVNAMSNPFTVSGLTQNTTYEFYITGVCGAGDESLQIGAVEGTTQCDAFVAPYVEDFENGFTPITTNFPGIGDAFDRENCYSAINNNYFWALASGGFTGNNGTGPDPSVTTGNYFYADGSGNDGDVADLRTPLFDSSMLTVPSVSFDYHMAGANIGSLDVVVRAAGAETIVGTLTGAQQASVNDPFININIPLTAYAGQTFQVIFRATRGNGSSSDIAIDNVVIDEAPTCAAPRSLTASTVTDVTAVLGWTAGDSETVWDIELITSGTTPTGVPTEAGVTVNPYNATNLMSGTDYEFYIRAVCAVGDESTWAGPFNFTTLPSCGDTVYDTGGANGQYTNNESYTITYLPSTPGDVVTLNFLSVDIESCCDTLQVFDGLDNTATPFSTDLEAPDLFRATNPDGAITITFSSDGSVVGDGWVAQYTCAAPPTCLEVSALSASNVTATSADLAWTSGGSGETAWDIEIVLAGTAPTGTPTNVATSNPYTANNLTSGTAYEFYVRADCGNGSTSLYSGPFAFSTIAACGDRIYDTGGSNGTYQNNENYTITYFPENPGDIVTLDFIMVDLESCCDTLDVFDGVDVTATPFALDLETPALFRATNADGAITVRFDSDGSVVRDGWEARYSCGPVPTCFEPTALTASNFTVDGATLSWTENNSPAATEWIVEYAEVGVITMPGTNQGTVINPATNSQDVTGLLPDTVYEYYVSAVCSVGDESVYSGPATFRTRCSALTAVYTTDYESDPLTGLNNCDSSIVNGGTGALVQVDDLVANSGSQHIYMYSGSSVPTDIIYILPEFSDLSSDKQVTFQAYDRDNGSLEVGTITDPNDPTTFTSLRTLTDADLPDDTYQEFTVYFNPLTTVGGFIAFKFIPNGTFDAMYIDDVTYDVAPACPAPSAVMTSNTTNDSVDIAWLENGTSTNWEVAVLPAPSGVPTSPGTAVTSNPYTQGGLSSATEYVVYVRSDCGSGSLSDWSAAATFTTECDALLAPYVEDFEMFTATSSTFPPVTEYFNRENCWKAVNSSLGWVVAPGTLTASGGTGPSPTVTTGNYMYTEGSNSASANRVAELVSPLIDLSPLMIPNLGFDYHAFGDDIQQVDVLVNDGVSNVVVFTFNGGQQTADVDPFLRSEVSLNSYAGQTVQITFRVTSGTSFETDFAIDNFEVSEAPSCPDPSLLTVSGISATSASFSWTENGNATSWQVEVQPDGVAQGTAGAIYENLAATNPQIITGLSAQNTFDVYVRADCGAGDFSSWVGPLSFTTPCDVFALPYGSSAAPGNDFATFPGNCWSEGNATDIATGPNGTDGAWGSDDFANDPASANGQAARINLYDNAGVDNDWLVTPSFDLTNAGHNFSATFDIALTEFAGTGASNFGSDDEIQLLITDDNGATWNNLATWNAASGVSNTGQQETVSLASYSGVVQLAFWSSRGTVSDTADIDFYVDNFTIDGTAGNDDAFAKADLKIYPNPVSSVLFVEADVDINKLTIYNLLGQIVSEKIVTDAPEIDVRNLPSGVYLIDIENGESHKTLRFIKE